MSQLTLKYFGLKARGEVARLILTGSGVAFKDVRYDFCQRPARHPETNKRLLAFDTPETDFTAAQWLKIKDSTPFGAMPLLEGVPGIQAPICQSRAIIRHCARLAGIEGETEVDKLLADMFADTGHEWLERLFTKYTYFVGTDFGNMKAEKRWARWDAISKVMRDEARDYLTRFESLHKAHFGEDGADYVAGMSLTHADYQLVVTLDFMRDLGYADIIEEVAPILSRCAARTKDNALLTEYLERNRSNVFTAAGFAF